MRERLIQAFKTGRTRPVRPLLAFVRLTVLAVIVAAIVVPVGFLILPIPARADGVTICLPAIGPLQQISDDLSPHLTELVELHEDVHAEQCRRLGAAKFASMYWSAPGRIALEAEAHCAELPLLEARGFTQLFVFERTVDVLNDGYRNDGLVPRREVARIVSQYCPTGGDRAGWRSVER